MSKLSIVAQSSFDAIGAIKSAAQSIHAGASALEIINTKAAELRANGVRFGKSVKTCAHRLALADSMALYFKGKAAKTYANYVTAFVGAVNDGETFSFSASKGQAAPKADGAKKATPKTDGEKMLAALLIAPMASNEDWATIDKEDLDMIQTLSRFHGRSSCAPFINP